MDAAQWDARYAEAAFPWGVEPNRFIRQYCERLQIGTALDLACGEGRNALWLAQLGWQTTGIDFSRVAIERARDLTARLSKRDALRIRWLVDDVTVFEPKVDSVDLALAGYVHIPPADRDAMLTRAAAALRPKGHLVVVAHDKRNLAEGVSGPQDLDLLYDPGELRALLVDKCGLVVEVARTAERETPSGVALDTVIRARRD